MKVNKKRMCVLLLMMLGMSISGCGTYQQRLSSEYKWPYTGYFKGVAYDVDVLTFKSRGWDDFLCYVTIVCPFVVLGSIPIDLAVDTILFPYDYSSQTR
jgi:uncharacterized protein YceK